MPRHALPADPRRPLRGDADPAGQQSARSRDRSLSSAWPSQPAPWPARACLPRPAAAPAGVRCLRRAAATARSAAWRQRPPAGASLPSGRRLRGIEAVADTTGFGPNSRFASVTRTPVSAPPAIPLPGPRGGWRTRPPSDLQAFKSSRSTFWRPGHASTPRPRCRFRRSDGPRPADPAAQRRRQRGRTRARTALDTVEALERLRQTREKASSPVSLGNSTSSPEAAITRRAAGQPALDEVVGAAASCSSPRSGTALLAVPCRPRATGASRWPSTATASGVRPAALRPPVTERTRRTAS